MVQIDEATYLYLFLIFPVMILLYIGLMYWKKKTQRRFAEPTLLKRLTPSKSSFKGGLKLLFLLLGLSGLILGLANPKIGTKLETVKREGVDIVFAIDVSKSMLAEDIAPQ
jgi:Ca-activated chloride channel family protein